MEVTDKIKDRIEKVNRKRCFHEHLIEVCMKQGTEKGVKHNKSIVKQCQNEIDFLEDLLTKWQSCIC